jgi:hypothetical protein
VGAVLAQADNNKTHVMGTAASGIRRSKVIWLSRLKSDAIIGERFLGRIACHQCSFAAPLRFVEEAVAPAQGA